MRSTMRKRMPRTWRNFWIPRFGATACSPCGMTSGELVGFFAYQDSDGVVDYGLGLHPDLTGKGLGERFVCAGLDFAQSRFSPKTIQLRVAAFNQRAIKVYERVGFREVERYMNRTNGGEFEFIRMELMDRPADFIYRPE